MTMICLNAPIGELRTFASANEHRRFWRLRGLRWLGLLYAMLFLSGYAARQHPASGLHESAAKDAASASLISSVSGARSMWLL